MGVLDSIERGIERAVNSAFARTFRSGVQPVEIAATLKRQLDIGAVIVDRDRVLTPNRFTVRVSPADHAKLNSLGDALERELRTVAVKYAKKQGYQMLGDLDVVVNEDSSLSQGVHVVDAESVEGAISWAAALIVNGTQHLLKQGTNVIGRGNDADVRLDDNGASRKHLEVHWNGKEAVAKDLGSTNGSKVNGHRFAEATLTPDTKITIGESTLTFVLVPLRQTPAPSHAPAPARTQVIPQPSTPSMTKPKGPDEGNTALITPQNAKDFWSSL